MKESPLEKLARSYEIRTLYNNKLPLFNNNKNFSYIQLVFLNMVERYNQLITDIAMGEENTEEGMEEDPLRVEAYFLWKSKKFKDMVRPEIENNNIDNNVKNDDVLYKIKFEG